MTLAPRFKLSTKTTASSMIFVAVSFIHGCGDECRTAATCARMIRQEQVLKLVAAKSLHSNIVHTKRSVVEFRHDYNFTSIQRRGYITEEGEYDRVWVASQGNYFAYAQYRYHYPNGSLDFLAVWPMGESDTAPVKFIMIERYYENAEDTTATVTTNIESHQEINQVVRVPFDTLRQKRLDIEVSYELIVIQPMEFFKQLQIGAHSLKYYSPESYICF